MKPAASNPVFLVCLAAAMLFSGCHKQQVTVAAPPAPPAATPEPQPTPAETQAQTQPTQPAGQGTPPPESQPAEPATEKTDTKAKSTKPKPAPKKTGTETARNVPPKNVVKDGAEPSSAGTISPALPHDEVVHDQASTEQLLQNTENTLNGIKRQLSPDEQAVVTQIRDFMNQSRQATKANDLTRAYNLAMKARLLADDLAKRH
jgi:hypothetical protein